MQEREFVESLMATVRSLSAEATAMRPVERMMLGIPDLLAWIPTMATTASAQWVEDNVPVLWALAIEAKALHPLMADPYHRGRRTGQMLKHPFTGPQISFLRMLIRSNVDAFGLVRVSPDIAFRIHPQDLPAKTGNFTHEELIRASSTVRRVRGLWQFWEPEQHNDQVSSSGHRGDPGDGVAGDVGGEPAGEGSAGGKGS